MHDPNSTRKLWVLRGVAAKLFDQVSVTISQHSGDWIIVTEQTNLPDSLINVILPNKTKKLLGQQYLHAIFDATQGFNLDAFAMLAGTLIKGSVLILFLPENFSTWQDQDSLRWNEKPYPIQVPNFVTHLEQTLNEFIPFPNYQFPQPHGSTCNLVEQQTILNKLLKSDKTIKVLIAKRGRGKSALAGQFTHFKDCLVTAPNKNALTTFFQFAKGDIPFYAPDELIASTIDNFPNYLIIDEAAMIPLPILEKLLQLAIYKNSHILLTTTVEGYEGTGQGFILKLLKNYSCEFFSLNMPIRWCDNDELESFTDHLLLNGLFPVALQPLPIQQPMNYSIVNRDDIISLKQIFYLLKDAHYQTTLVDLRRIFDAQNLAVWQVKIGNNFIAAAITINEGNLSDELIDDIWKGVRRPKGNLVAQSLVAHAGNKQAAKLMSVRINRIAVIESYRRQHIAHQLIQNILEDAIKYGKDYLSVSFAYHHETSRFWSMLGFMIVHVGSHKEASSGSYSIMAIKPITTEGYNLAYSMNKRLRRNIYWLKNIIDLPFDNLLLADSDQHLSTQDLEELQGFCHYHRSYEATYAALCRLNLYNDKQSNLGKLPVLAMLLLNKKCEALVIQQFNLTGRKALIQTIKQEVKQWLDNYF
jgi:tRNA(Met) cytidine acetyltransferase